MVGAIWQLRPRACLPPLWRELTWPLRAAGCAGGPVPVPVAPRGAEVMLIPGLFSGDAVLGRLGRHLAAAGHRVHGTGMAVNVDCSERAVDRLVGTVRRIADARGEPVALVGHSRGGLFARAVAQRAPHEVSGVVSLAAPHRDQLALHPLLWAQLMAVGLLGTLGLPGLLRPTCMSGGCCARFRDDLSAHWPAGVGLVSVYSRADGVVDWRACLDRRGDNVEVDSSHCGMIADPGTYAVVLSALESFAAPRIPHLRAAA